MDNAELELLKESLQRELDLLADISKEHLREGEKGGEGQVGSILGEREREREKEVKREREMRMREIEGEREMWAREREEWAKERGLWGARENEVERIKSALDVLTLAHAELVCRAATHCKTYCHTHCNTLHDTATYARALKTF